MSESKHILNNGKEINEYHKLELEEIFNKSRSLLSLRIQIFSFIGTANLTILGLAFTSQKAILIFFAAGLMSLLMSIDSFIRPSMDVILARGIQIEKLYSDDKDALFMSIILASIDKPKKAYTFSSKILEANNQNEIIKLIRSRPFNYKLGIWLPVSVAIIDSIGGILVLAFNIMPLV